MSAERPADLRDCLTTSRTLSGETPPLDVESESGAGGADPVVWEESVEDAPGGGLISGTRVGEARRGLSGSPCTAPVRFSLLPGGAGILGGMHILTCFPS